MMIPDVHLAALRRRAEWLRRTIVGDHVSDAKLARVKTEHAALLWVIAELTDDGGRRRR